MEWQADLVIADEAPLGRLLAGDDPLLPKPGFVPEPHTVSVFTVAGEELGLIGAGLLMIWLGIVIW
ncbi:hypothetical protein F0U44_22290, partial [Nocardioides humilatus]